MAGPTAKVAYRIWAPLWRDDTIFTRLTEFLTRTGQRVDEVALFNAYIHVPGRELGEVDRACAVLAERMARLREAGIPSVGINVLGTMGHGIHRGARPMPFQQGTSPDGGEGAGICITAPQFLEYTTALYRRMADARPAFVWMDDDLRYQPGRACFCGRCLEAFGWPEGREKLTAGLRDPAGAELRARWSAFLADQLTGLCRRIAEAVRSVDDRIDVGIMTVGHSCTTYGNYPIRRMFDAAGAVKCRPGHGYYCDDPRCGMVGKALDVARQVRELPGHVLDIQYELENWPYVTFDKAVATVTNECTMSLAAGCNGVALNALSECSDRFDDYRPLARAVAAHRPVWDRLADACAGMSLRGFWPADHTELAARRWDVAAWPACTEPADYEIQRPCRLGEMGIPLTADRRAACGVLLAGRVAEAFGTDELRDMLAGAVYLDEKALEVLWAKGLGEQTGVRPSERVFTCFERLATHPLNGPEAGNGRRAMHYSDSATLLEPVGGAPVETLAEAVASESWTPLGPCMTACTNELGGWVVVATYQPWQYLGRTGKRRQLQSVFDWLAGGRMPVRIDAPVRVWPMVRLEPAAGRGVAVLQNMALDPTPPLPVRMGVSADRVVRLTCAGQVDLPARPDGDATRIDVPALAPWEQAVLLASARP